MTSFESSTAFRTHRPRHTAVLFLAMFAAQSAFLALVSTLPQVGFELRLSAGLAGQLGAVSGLAGLVVAIVIARLGSRARAARVVVSGLTVLIAASVLTALAESIAVIAVAQAMAGGAAAAIAVGATAAAFIWPSPQRRAGVLAWVVLGSPGAWIVGSPFVGAVAERDWRAVWLLPICLALIVLAALRFTGAPTDVKLPRARTGVFRSRPLRRWMVGELLAFTGWNGVLVYASALFVGVYGLAPSTTGLLLAAIVVVYFPATLLARRFAEIYARSMLGWLAVLAAPIVFAIGTLQSSPWMTAVMFALLAAINGSRGLAGGVRGQQLAQEQPIAISGLRISIMQAAGISGAAIGGGALALGGWPALGVALAVVYVGSAIAQQPFRNPAIGALRPNFGSATDRYGNSADVGAQARI